MDNEGVENEFLTRKNQLSKVGWALFKMAVLIQIVQIVLVLIVNTKVPELWEKPWFSWLLVAVSFYMIAFPIYCIEMKKIPSGPKDEPKKLTFGKIIVAFFICMATMYLFNSITLIINYLIGLLKGSPVVNPLTHLFTSSNMFYTFLSAGIFAPIIEEIVFRGLLLDKLRGFGDKTAIWITALAFGLFHMNLSQFFYATALGLVLAYIAIRTNQIKYTIILHMSINIIGSVIAPFMTASENQIVVMAVGIMVPVFLFVGILLFLKEKKNIVLDDVAQPTETAVSRKTIYGSAGMIAFIILCLFFIVISTIE